ncbi:MAG: hypothetical protein COB35_03630 [Gammaproteobacteria bacterium]|nr:MAG: hypothetical protein COB35_03630 [Gammaproteobacteria bacterium]
MDYLDRLINNLPLKKIGNDRESCASVYLLTCSLNSDVMLALKANGYHKKNSATLEDGTNVDNVWVQT